MAVRRWWLRGLICGAALAVVLVSWHKVLAPWWDSAADIQEMLDNQLDGIGNEGIDEYVPTGVDPYEVDQKAPLAKFEGGARGHIAVTAWEAESKSLTVNSDSDGKAVLRLFNYPLWRVTVNGSQVHGASTSITGQIVVPLNPGENRIQIAFRMGADRKLGIVVSLFTALALALFWAITGRKVLSPA